MRKGAKALKNDPDARMDYVASTAAGMNAFPEADFAKLDRSRLPEWIGMLRTGESNVRQLRTRLESLASESARHCPVCGSVVTGRADRVYCGPTCRQRARRANLADPMRTGGGG